MARPVPEVTSAPPQTLFGRDRLVVEQTVQQIRSDLGYADAMVHWSEGLERQTDMILRMRDSLRARTQERLTLTQTSVLGAVIAALTVVSALHVTVPGPEAVQWSMVPVVFFLGLGLPALVMHRSEGYRGSDALLTGLFLASLCGLSYALFTWHAWLGLASAGLSLVLVVGGIWLVIANWRRKPVSTSTST
jgi:peptidoglycan/LPS O-acetylase OafA/YrhL